MNRLQASGRSVGRKLEGARIAVLTHRNADLDAVGSAVLILYSLRDTAREACIYLPEGASRSAKLALERLGLEPPLCDENDRFDVAIAVDSANLVQLGPAAAIYKEASFRVAIDHHERGSVHDEADELYIEVGASSSVELAVRFLEDLGLRPSDPRAATLALAGLVSDSRRFLIVGSYTFAAAHRLVEWGGDYRLALEIAQAPRQPGSDPADLGERIAKLRAFSRLRLARACTDILIAVTHVGSYESVVARSLVEEGADVAAVVTERRDHFRVSIRVSRRALDSGVTAAEIARFVAEKTGGEGGGHEAAAMAHVPVSSASSAEELADAIAKSVPGRVGRLCVEGRKARAGGAGSERGEGEEAQDIR